MAKESMITRTITTTTCIVLCLDVENGEPVNRSFVIPRIPKNEKLILKFAEKELAVKEPNVKPVHVVDTVEDSKIYGMTENDFLKYAKEVVRGKKAE